MSSQRASRPLVGVVSDTRTLGKLRHYAVGEKYVAALADGAGVSPILLAPLRADEGLPQRVEIYDVDALLDSLSGLFLPGSESNLEPWRYDAAPDPRDTSWRDPHRDTTSLTLIRAAIDRGLPLFSVCRGFQEMNVALGGTLHQQLHHVDGLDGHHAPEGTDLDTLYGPFHQVSLTPGGMLRRLAGTETVRVNSVHHQGVERLADALTLEARAPDGLAEAASVAASPGFALGVQWHPEWRYWEDPLSRALFAAFGDAVRQYASQRSPLAAV